MTHNVCSLGSTPDVSWSAITVEQGYRIALAGCLRVNSTRTVRARSKYRVFSCETRDQRTQQGSCRGTHARQTHAHMRACDKHNMIN